MCTGLEGGVRCVQGLRMVCGVLLYVGIELRYVVGRSSTPSLMAV
jgi:hypothetical protein